MDLSHHKNAKVLAYCSREFSNFPKFAAHDSEPDPYYGCGCHPDIVDRLWNQIGAILPEDCRGLVGRTPGLIHPKTGVILAIGIGTKYGLRLSGGLVGEAIKAGVKTRTVWSGGKEMDIVQDLGDDWVFGAWLAEELCWCKKVHELNDCPI